MTWKSSLTIVATTLMLTGTAAAQTPGTAPSSPGLPTPGTPPAPTPAPTPRPPSSTTPGTPGVPGTPGTTVPPSISDPGRTSPTFPCGPGQVRQPGSTACGPPVPGAPTLPK